MAPIIHAVRASNENARAFAYRVLAAYIRELLLRPGQRLSVAEVAVQLSVSRTPVHDTFAQLSREKMLAVEPQRGTYVKLLSPDNIRQLCWMNQTTSHAVLEKIYAIRPGAAALEKLNACLQAERQALQSGNLVAMARLDTEFHCCLFELGGHLPIYRALRRVGVDLYRMYRLADDTGFWQGIVNQHAALAAAIAAHNHEAACMALDVEYSVVEPLLAYCQKHYPHFFEPAAVAG